MFCACDWLLQFSCHLEVALIPGSVVFTIRLLSLDVLCKLPHALWNQISDFLDVKIPSLELPVVSICIENVMKKCLWSFGPIEH